MIPVILLLGLQAPPAALPPPFAASQELLRSGRFDEAASGFSAIAAERLDDPEGPFFEGFTLWWRLLDKPADREALQLRMEGHFGEAARRADRMAASEQPALRRRGLTLAGASRLLQAQSSAARGAHRAAADAARRGHGELTLARRLAPEDPDPLFALGAYNYYADHLPILVKGLRFLFNIPGGDAETGLAQLEEAAGHSPLFGTESLMLLAHIHSSGEAEGRAGGRDGRRALGWMEEAAIRHPSSPLIRVAWSDLLYRTGRFRDAAVRAAEAMALLQARDGYSAALEPHARYRIAATGLRLGDPGPARQSALDVLRRGGVLRQAEARRWGLLFVEASIEAGAAREAEATLDDLDLPRSVRHACRERLAPALADPAAPARKRTGDAAPSLAELESLVRSYPSSGWIRLRLGRLLEEAGRRDEAMRQFQRSATLGPAEIEGAALLHLGWIEEQEGDRQGALGYYRRAAALRKFDFPLAVHERLIYPGTPRPEF